MRQLKRLLLLRTFLFVWRFLSARWIQITPTCAAWRTPLSSRMALSEVRSCSGLSHSLDQATASSFGAAVLPTAAAPSAYGAKTQSQSSEFSRWMELGWLGWLSPNEVPSVEDGPPVCRRLKTFDVHRPRQTNFARRTSSWSHCLTCGCRLAFCKCLLSSYQPPFGSNRSG